MLCCSICDTESFVESIEYTFCNLFRTFSFISSFFCCFDAFPYRTYSIEIFSRSWSRIIECGWFMFRRVHRIIECVVLSYELWLYFSRWHRGGLSRSQPDVRGHAVRISFLVLSGLLRMMQYQECIRGLQRGQSHWDHRYHCWRVPYPSSLSGMKG